MQLQVCTDGLQLSFIKGETTMEFFNSAIEVLQTLVVALVGITLIPLLSGLFG